MSPVAEPSDTQAVITDADLRRSRQRRNWLLLVFVVYWLVMLYGWWQWPELGATLFFFGVVALDLRCCYLAWAAPLSRGKRVLYAAVATALFLFLLALLFPVFARRRY